MHLWVALARRVVRRSRRLNDRRIHDGGDAYTLAVQIQVRLSEYLPAYIVLFQNVTEALNRCLIRRRRPAQVHEAHCFRVPLKSNLEAMRTSEENSFLCKV